MNKNILIGVVVVAMILAGASWIIQRQNTIANLPGNSPTATSTPSSTFPVVVCAANQHSCPCATGNYCLSMGAMCISPDSACPSPTSTKNATTTGAVKALQKPHITSLSPNIGPASRVVLISGSGFAPAGNNIEFGSGSLEGDVTISNIPSDGSSLIFSVPKGNPRYGGDTMMLNDFPAGQYHVSVSNANGISNSLVFTLDTGHFQYGPIANPNNDLGPQSIAAGSKSVKVGSYVLNNPDPEALSISSIVIQAGENGGIFANMKLVENGNRFGNTQGAVKDNGNIVFSGAPFLIPSNGVLVVDVYADVVSSAKIGSTNKTSFITCTAIGQTTQKQYVCGMAGGQTLTVKASGR